MDKSAISPSNALMTIHFWYDVPTRRVKDRIFLKKGHRVVLPGATRGWLKIFSVCSETEKKTWHCAHWYQCHNSINALLMCQWLESIKTQVLTAETLPERACSRVINSTCVSRQSLFITCSKRGNEMWGMQQTETPFLWAHTQKQSLITKEDSALQINRLAHRSIDMWLWGLTFLLVTVDIIPQDLYKWTPRVYVHKCLCEIHVTWPLKAAPISCFLFLSQVFSHKHVGHHVNHKALFSEMQLLLKLFQPANPSGALSSRLDHFTMRRSSSDSWKMGSIHTAKLFCAPCKNKWSMKSNETPNNTRNSMAWSLKSTVGNLQETFRKSFW